LHLVESEEAEKKKRKRHRKPEVEFKLSLRKTTYFLYKGPARYIKFIAVVLVLGFVNAFAEFKISTFPENLAALFLCLTIISIVALTLHFKK
jgi:hypothetical protein